MKKAIALTLVVIMLVLPLPACADAREVNSWAFPYMLGIDKGVSDKLRFTILLPTLQEKKENSGGGGQIIGDTTVVSIDCPTLTSGINLMNSFISRVINYTHAELLVIGEELAKEGVSTFFEGMRVARQIRMDMSVVVVKGEASAFIEAFQPAVGQSVPGALQGLMNPNKETGIIEAETFLHMLQALKSSDEQASCILGALNDFSSYLPAGSETEQIEVQDLLPGEIPRKGGNQIELLGTAVFSGDRLAGELDLSETRALLMVKGEFISAAISVHDPLDEQYYVTSRIQPSENPEIKVDVSGDIPMIDIKVMLVGSIQNQQSEIPYMEDDYKPVLENAYAESIARSIGDAITKCQGFGSDIFGFASVAKKSFLTIQQWESYGWRDKFKDAQVRIEVSFNMIRTGIVVDNNPVQNGGGGQ